MYFALEGGGTKGLVYAYSSLSATVPIGEVRFPMTSTTPEKRGDFKQDFTHALGACRQLQDELRLPLEGVGFSLAGKHDRGRRTLLTAGNLDHWSGEPFVNMLEDSLGCRVVLGGDGEAAALAEALYGLGRELEYTGEDFILVIWGTGIGGGAVFYSHEGTPIVRALEPGHLQLRKSKVLCGCGQTGCLEAYCGGNGIRRRFRGRPAERLNSSQWDMVIADMVVGMRGILTVSPVNLVVFSGGQPCKDPWLLPRIEDELKHPMLGGPRLRISHFEETAGMLGALSLLSIPAARN